MDQSKFEHLQRTDKGYSPRPTTQSDPDSQTDPLQARNSASGCNAAPSHGRRTGFEIGRVGESSCKLVHPFSDDPMRCIRRTTTDCCGCRSSRAVYRLDRSGSNGFSGSSRLNHAGMTFLKLLHLSENLCLSFCPRRRRYRPKSLCCRLF